jgi:hypothetical protein
VEQGKSLISVVEFKRLLVSLKEKRPDISVRYRLLGEMWAMNFRPVVFVSERGAIFLDIETNKLILISDLSNIMQFEIDEPFQGYQPYYHYEVKPSPEFTHH